MNRYQLYRYGDPVAPERETFEELLADICSKKSERGLYACNHDATDIDCDGLTDEEREAVQATPSQGG